MCFNYEVSLFTFCIGTIFSVLLICSGNKKYIAENIITGIFLIFISMIQLMDFLFWIDLGNKYGINKIVTILGPILNVAQPTILYIIKYLYFKPDIMSLTDGNLPIAINIKCGIFIVFFVWICDFFDNR